uniref:Uncharacterized protein n=1 Tax=Balbiania investiens TaxID=111861 RepID=A0A4D6BKT6_9FLOR|nr:hypothetical protein [Balbiania investiens]QBX88582.1 hypothetical protein [Balbiania investiens]
MLVNEFKREVSTIHFLNYYMSIIYFMIEKEDDSVGSSASGFHNENVARAQLVLVHQYLKHLYILSYIHVKWNHLVFFYSGQYTCQLHYGLILYLLHEIYLYNSIRSMVLDVKSDNFKALSLYIWLDYAFVQERKNYYSRRICSLHLVYFRSPVKNFWRRLLILH